MNSGGHPWEEHVLGCSQPWARQLSNSLVGMHSCHCYTAQTLSALPPFSPPAHTSQAVCLLRKPQKIGSYLPHHGRSKMHSPALPICHPSRHANQNAHTITRLSLPSHLLLIKAAAPQKAVPHTLVDSHLNFLTKKTPGVQALAHSCPCKVGGPDERAVHMHSKLLSQAPHMSGCKSTNNTHHQSKSKGPMPSPPQQPNEICERRQKHDVCWSKATHMHTCRCIRVQGLTLAMPLITHHTRTLNLPRTPTTTSTTITTIIIPKGPCCMHAAGMHARGLR